MKTRQAIRLGVIGCGAVAQICHLPATRRLEDVKIVALADTDLSRARLLGRKFGIERCTANFLEFLNDVDGVIIAVPHALHVPIAEEVLQRRVPVLVEKPLAASAEEAQRLVAISREKGVPLQAGYMLRYSAATRLVKRVIDEGWLGPLRTFSLDFGALAHWPNVSGFKWRKLEAGGGVLIDTGSHMLDLLAWWLGPATDVKYFDDSRGGVEAECRLRLTLRTALGDVQGDVLLSRLRDLDSAAVIHGDRATVECRLGGRYEARMRPRTWVEHDPSFAATFNESPADTFGMLFVHQLHAFAEVIRSGTQPALSGESVLPTVTLIERCYRERKPLSYAWESGERGRGEIA